MNANKLIELSQDLICITDDKGVFTFLNPAYTDMLGYDAKELINKPFFNIVHPDDLEKTNKEFENLLISEKTINFNNRYIHKNGSVKYIEWKATSVSCEKSVYATGRDITESKLREFENTELEVRLNALINCSTDFMFLLEQDGNIKIANEAFANNFGVSVNKLIGLNVYDLLPKKDGVRRKKAADKIIKERKPIVYSDERSGHFYETHIFPSYTNGNVELAMFTRDITERKLIEGALIASEEKFRNLADTAQVAISIVTTNYEKGILYVNKYWEKITGYTKHESLQLQALDIVHPDQKAMVNERATRRLAGETVPDHYEMKILTKSNQTKWVDITITLIDYEGTRAILTTAIDITERKHAEIKLRDEKEQIKTILNLVNDPIFVKDDNHRITMANKAFFDIFNLDENKVIGYTLAEQVPENEREQFLATDRKVLDTGIPDLREETLTSDGITKTIVTSKTRFIDESGNKFLVGSIHDITVQKNAIVALAKSENRLSLALETGHIGAWDLNLQDQSSHRTLIHDQIFGYKTLQSKWTFEMFMEHVLPEDRTDVEKTFKKALETISDWNFECRIKRIDGKMRWIKSTGKHILNSDGKPIALSGIIQDISEHKWSEVELVRAKKRAEESDRLKSAFVANMSHEIRTPMNSILGFSGLLSSSNLTIAKKDKYLSIIMKSGDRMLNIIDDIMDISKIEAGLVTVEIEEFDINEQIDYLYNIFKQEVEAKGMNLLFKKGLLNKEAKINTDKDKFIAILSNLIKNAIKYTEEGNIEYGYELISNGEDSIFKFVVKDTGIGISEDRQDAIFERFVQADIQDVMAREGAGLGLAITKAHIEMLNGEIWVDSNEGEGSAFYFTLPSKVSSDVNQAIQNSVASDKSNN